MKKWIILALCVLAVVIAIGFKQKHNHRMADTFESNPMYNRLEVVKVGKHTLTKNANALGKTDQIPHGLGYRPVIIAFLDDGNELVSLPYTLFVSSSSDAEDGRIIENILAAADDTNAIFNITVSYLGGGGNFSRFDNEVSVNITYYLLREKSD